MTVIKPTVTDEMIEQVAEAMYVAERPAVGGDWGREGDAYRALYVDSARAALEAAAPLIAAQAKVEALRELRDYLAEPRRVWFGDMGVRVALDIDDPRSHLSLSAYLDLRASQIEVGRCCTHAKCPGGSLCCCTEEAGR